MTANRKPVEKARKKYINSVDLTLQESWVSIKKWVSS